MKSKNIILASIAVALLLSGIGYIASRKTELSNKEGQRFEISNTRNQQSEKNLTPVHSFLHAHGLSVDGTDPSKLFIATHEGLFLLRNEKDLYQIGKSKDDFMGFSPHPAQAQVFYSSGHPRQGGNLGVQKSEDGGVTWKKISNGAHGPVDFHAMAISSANPNVMYGWYSGLQKSEDGGIQWKTVSAILPNVISFTADSRDEKRVYASTVQGLFSSNDGGDQWSSYSPDLASTAVTVFALNPRDSQKALSFSEKLGLARSEDGGKTWKGVEGIRDIVFHIAFDKNTPEKAYLLTKSNVLYKTLDNGTTWQKIRE